MYLGTAKDTAQRSREADGHADPPVALRIVEERDRIAMDLHDGVVQSLVAVGMRLQAAEELSDAGQMRAWVDQAVAELEQTIVDLRDYIYDLHDEHGPSLASSLVRVAAAFAPSGLAITLQAQPAAVAAFAAVHDDVVHVVRETLSNAARHSSSGLVRVRLLTQPGASIIEVTNDGLPSDIASGSGDGMANLLARAETMGATLEVETAPDGTVFRLRMPRGEQ